MRSLVPISTNIGQKMWTVGIEIYLDLRLYVKYGFHSADFHGTPITKYISVDIFFKELYLKRTKNVGN